MDAEALYDVVADLDTKSHDPEVARKLITLADESLAEMSARDSDPYDAETCRLVMLAAAKLDEFELMRVWRSRALARFAEVGWVEGVGMIIMSEAFTELSRANRFYQAGRTIDVLITSPTALAMLDEMARFTEGPGSGFELAGRSPSQASLRRLYPEKRGFLLLLGEDFQASRASYEVALAAAANERGKVKVRLALLLVDYLGELAEGMPTSGGNETRRLGEQAAMVASSDLTEIAEHNAKVMDAGGRSLMPYEIL